MAPAMLPYHINGPCDALGDLFRLILDVLISGAEHLDEPNGASRSEAANLSGDLLAEGILDEGEEKAALELVNGPRRVQARSGEINGLLKVRMGLPLVDGEWIRLVGVGDPRADHKPSVIDALPFLGKQGQALSFDSKGRQDPGARV